MAEKLDHGVVNLPLDKRGGGSLDAQIDRFKAGQQRDAKAAAKDKHARSVEAKEFVDNMDDAQLRRLAEKAGMTVVQARKKLLSMARFEPDKVLRLKAAQPTEETMRSLIRQLEEAKKSNPKHAQDAEGRARILLRQIRDDPGISDVVDSGRTSPKDRFLRTVALLPQKGQSAYKHDVMDKLEKDVRAHKKANDTLAGNESEKHREMDPKTKAAFSRAFSALGSNEQPSAGASSADDDRKARRELADVSAKHRELGAGGGHVGTKKIFTGKKSAMDQLKAGGPASKGADAGGEGTMPGPEGEVDGKWVTVRGKRMFFPNDPGEGVPEGPWGGAPWRPGWTGKGGDWRKGRGVPKQKGQMSLFGKNEDMQSLFQRLEEEAGRSKEIADEILRQLGGRRFLVMTGARNLLAFDTLDAERKWPGLQVQFPHGNAKVMRIALAPDDTYVIQFMTRAGRITKEMDDIYSEVLQRVVSDYTGLALSL